MGEFAAIESFEALQRLRIALCRFAEQVGAALDEAEAELQRTGFWVKQEQSGFWKREGDKRAELLARAKSALSRKKLQTTALGGRAACDEEEKALAIAMRRVEEARQKAANVRRWSRRLDDEVFAYQAVASGMSQTLAIEIPNALTQLDNMLAALEAYVASTAPELQGSLAETEGSTGTFAEGELESMARAAPSSPPEIEKWRRLRAQTPPPAVCDALPLTELDESEMHAGEPEPAWWGQLASLGLVCVPGAPEDRIVVARGALEQPRIYLERVETPSAGDSGWYVGIVEGVESPAFDALRVADLLSVRPDLAPLLELAAGSLVVLDGAALVAVLDGADRPLWPAPGVGP
jgi:hypothetical protein